MIGVKQRTSIDTFIFIFIFGVLTLCVRGQVVCRASFNCAGGPGDDLGVAVDGAGCCLGNPDAMAYTPQGSKECIACVVVGFLNTSFSGPEQGSGHSVPVGYLKGGMIAGKNLVFNVRNIQGTAREGSQFDYTVNTLRARALANGQISNMVLTFHVDSIAQESNETFTLTLDPLIAPNPREGLFFRNTIEVTILDSDSVEFAFTEPDYRANEPDSINPATFQPILVSKSTRIASRVELVVVPLTVDKARATSLPLPPNIPDNDQRSPPFANLADFNNTNITLVFEPDEDSEINEKSAPIFITDDAINEATEQVFIAELILLSSLDPATVDLSIRPSTLCRIIDNDPIRIGFELPGYTYTEPQFDEFIDEFYVSPTGQPENGPIFLAKEDNVTSEQTFFISFQVTDSAPFGIQPATIDQDYRFGPPGETSTNDFFFPTQQRIPFPFELRADTLPEGTKAFQASVSATRDITGRTCADGLLLPFICPDLLNILRSEIFITILDDDPIIIGFVDTSYTVEGIGTLQVDVRVHNVPDDQPLTFFVFLSIYSAFGFATFGSNSFTSQFVCINDANRQRSFPVIIKDDVSLILELNAFESPPPNVILYPSITTVTIDNGDCNTCLIVVDPEEIVLKVEIGFLNTSYTVNKDDGLVDIQVGLTNEGVILGIPVRKVRFFISQSQSDRDSLRTDILEVNPTTPIIDLSVAITDYLLEFSESVVANIDFVGEPTSGVTLDPANASININALIIGFNSTNYCVLEGAQNVTLAIQVRGGVNQCNEMEWMLDYVVRNTSSQPSEDNTDTGTVYVNYTSQSILVIPLIMVDDNILNLNKILQVEISLQNREDRNCVLLQPNVANITITDDDVVFIDVVSDIVTITEGEERYFNLTAEIRSDGAQLGIEVVAEISICEGSTAKSGSDFVINGGQSQVFTFGPEARVHSFSITIVDDNIFETDEMLLVSLSTNTTNFVDFDFAILTIEDDDNITIGFNSTTYTVRESDFMVALCIGLISGELDDTATVNVRLNTVSGTAHSLDYEDETVRLAFSGGRRMRIVNLFIIDDNVLETNETFTAVLELVGNDRIILQPKETEVSIVLDDDTVVIGFTEEIYTVSEGVGMFTDITVGLIEGGLGLEVVITEGPKTIVG